MRNGKIWKQMAALMISAALAVPAPTASAADMEGIASMEQGQEEQELSAVQEAQSADNNGFEIKDGVLVKYTGTASKVVIPAGVKEIGNRAFAECSSMTDVTIPNSVTYIGLGAFAECSSLTSITIPNGVTSIEYNTFGGCSSLQSVVIPDSVTIIKHLAFNGCSSLQSVTIPASVESIWEFAFSGCSQLTEVNIPSGVTSIGNGAFANCSKLVKVTIPKSVEIIGASAFMETKWLEDKRSENPLVVVNQILIDGSGCSGSVVVPDGVTYIAGYAFHGSGLTNISIPASVAGIGQDAFFETEWLENKRTENPLVIVNHILVDGTNCSGAVTIPDGVSVIGGGAFSQCSKLTSINMPSGVTNIGENAFSGCSSLKGINIPDSVSSIGPEAFGSCSSLISISIPHGVTSIRKQAFSYCSKLTNISIPNSVASIDEYAFLGCSSLASINIPDSVSSIGSFVFFDCSNLKSVGIPGSVKYIGQEAFGYYAGNGQDAKIPGFKIRGNSGSAAETYAKENGFAFESLSSTGVNVTITCRKKTYSVAYGVKPFKISASSKSKLTFTSSASKIAAVDKNTGKVTVKGTGVAVITVKAGNKSVKVTVKVSPKKASVKSASAKKGKKLAVSWAKDKRASGYQVQVSTDKKFKKGVKSKNVSKAAYTFTKLKAGKKYYVRIRSYKNVGKEKLYGAWSKAKLSGKIKK